MAHKPFCVYSLIFEASGFPIPINFNRKFRNLLAV